MHIGGLFIYEYIFRRHFPHKILDVDCFFFLCVSVSVTKLEVLLKLLQLLGRLHYSSLLFCHKVGDPQGADTGLFGFFRHAILLFYLKYTNTVHFEFFHFKHLKIGFLTNCATC